MNDKYKNIIDNQRIRNRLHDAGVYPIMGPRGPKGEDGRGLQILNNYETYDELVKLHPIGNVGDCYSVNGILYIWDNDNNEWNEIGSI